MFLHRRTLYLYIILSSVLCSCNTAVWRQYLLILYLNGYVTFAVVALLNLFEMASAH